MNKSSSESKSLTEEQIRAINSLDSVNVSEVKQTGSSGAGWSVLSIISAVGSITAKLFHDRLAVVIAMDAGDPNSALLVVRDSHNMPIALANFMLWTATILTIVAILAAVFACHIDKSAIRRTAAVVLSAASLLYWFILV